MPVLLGVGTAFLFLVETNMAVLVGALSLVAVRSGIWIWSISADLLHCKRFSVISYFLDCCGTIGSQHWKLYSWINTDNGGIHASAFG